MAVPVRSHPQTHNAVEMRPDTALSLDAVPVRENHNLKFKYSIFHNAAERNLVLLFQADKFPRSVLSRPRALRGILKLQIFS